MFVGSLERLQYIMSVDLAEVWVGRDWDPHLICGAM